MQFHLPKIAGTFILCLLALGAPLNAANKRASADPVSAMMKGLVDQDGRALDDGRLAGRYVLVNFVFTSCGNTCPTQTAELARFDKSLIPAMQSRVRLVSISVDPGNDDAASLRTFASAHAANFKRWSFATGRPDRVFRVLKNFTALRPGGGPEMHTTEVYLFDPAGRMIQRYGGVPLATRNIRQDLTALVQLAGK